MLKIVVPMAGLGSRFAEAGYKDPKPLIPVHGIPMIEVVVNNLRPRQNHQFIFICQQQHDRQYGLKGFLKSLDPSCNVICIDGFTEGAACTVLKAREQIDNDHALMIANCDQWVNYPIGDYLDACESSRCAGFLMTMQASATKWSYVQRDQHGNVCAVVEKQAVSNEATVGIYNFARGRDFVAAAESMIAADLRVNNEFYVAPTYTELARRGQRIGTLSVGTDADGMYGLGTPADLQRFLTLNLADRLAEQRQSARRAA